MNTCWILINGKNLVFNSVPIELMYSDIITWTLGFSHISKWMFCENPRRMFVPSSLTVSLDTYSCIKNYFFMFFVLWNSY